MKIGNGRFVNKLLLMFFVMIGMCLILPVTVQAANCGYAIKTCECGDSLVTDYTLTSADPITSSTCSLAGNGLQIYASGIILDCAGHAITGTSTPTHGIAVGSSGVTVKNCSIKGFKTGITFSGSDITIQDNNISEYSYTGINSSSGFAQAYNMVLNNEVTGDGLPTSGIFLGANMNFTEVSGNIVKNNANFDIQVLSSDNAIFNNLLWSARDAGPAPNVWHSDGVPGVNIIGGPIIAGNYWTDESGAGYSDTCYDLEQDGLCDDALPYGYIAGNGGVVDLFPLAPPPPPIVDADNDGVEDSADNCIHNVNPHQENVNQPLDADGDVCDSDTYNAILESDLNSDLHVSTPLYRAKIASSSGDIFFDVNNGYGGTNKVSVGMPEGIPDSDLTTLQFSPTGFDIGAPMLAGSQNLTQSHWQMAVATDVYSNDYSTVRTHYASGANYMNVLQEVMDISGVTGDVESTWALTLPGAPGQFAVVADDANAYLETGAESKLTIIDATTGIPLYRISAVKCVANGNSQIIMDDCAAPAAEDADPSTVDFMGFSRLIEELAGPNNVSSGEVASHPVTSPTCEPLGGAPEEGYRLGINHRDGVTTSFIKMEQEFHENQADNELGIWKVGSGSGPVTLSAVCSYSFADKNKKTSSRMGIGFEISSLVDASTPSYAHILGRHAVVFNEELDVTWNAITWKFRNDTDESFTLTVDESRFDGNPTDYALFPNDGLTCAFNDCASVHMGLAFAGSTVEFTGNSTLNFQYFGIGKKGGLGVVMTPGDRVASADTCITSDPIDFAANTGRCLENYHKRGQLTVGNALSIQGSLSGLVCVDSNCEGQSLTASLGDDENAVDKNMARLRVGLGCAAVRGPQIGWNVLTDEYLANVPIDTTTGTYVNGVLIPQPLSDPGNSGICNLDFNYVVLTGNGDYNRPRGLGIACNQQHGKCNVGNISVNSAGVCVPGVGQGGMVYNFDTGVEITGGPNTHPNDGVPLRHNELLAVPPLKACLNGVSVHTAEVAVALSGNSDTTLHEVNMYNCDYNCLDIANVSANVATVENTANPISLLDNEGNPFTVEPCKQSPSVEPGIAAVCSSRPRDFFSPRVGIAGKPVTGISNIQLGPINPIPEPDHLAAIAGGITAPTIARIEKAGAACNTAGILSAGLEAVLPDALIPPTEEDPIVCDMSDLSKPFTLLDTPACALKRPIGIVKGADMLLYPELLQVSINGNICVGSPGIFIDDTDNVGGPLNVDLTGACFLKSDGTCQTSDFFNTAKGDVSLLESKAEAQVASKPQLVGADENENGCPDFVELKLGISDCDLESCSGAVDLAKTMTQWAGNNGVKNALETLLGMIQSSSSNVKRCEALSRAASKVAQGQNGVDAPLDFNDAIERAQSLCCVQ